MIESDVKIQSSGLSLVGTLSEPLKQNAKTVVLCIQGSGPLDRNSNSPKMELGLFDVMAKEFCEKQIACLRFDKRGTGQSEGNYYQSGHFDFVNDVAGWIKFLREKGFQKIFLLGHSEGTIIAAQLAKDVEGLILLCPFVESLEKLLIMQAKELEKNFTDTGKVNSSLYALFKFFWGSIPETQEKLIERIKTSNSSYIKHFFKKIPAKWIRELNSLDYGLIYSKVDIPSLVIGGKKDIQCSHGDVNIIAETMALKADSLVYPNLTHILRNWKEEDYSFGTYSRQIKQEVDPSLVCHLTNWVVKQESK